MNFKILIDDFFESFNTAPELNPIDKKKVISIINDFEDGKWRYNEFQNFVWDNIAETALSFRERQSLINQPLSQLTEAAKKLRLTDKEKDISKGSELAEIVLYGLMKSHFKALPVVPKIYYKQNPKDNAKGADSVHIVVEKDDFTLWFGEAKFYSSIDDTRLNSIITSVENSLRTDKIKKENSIVTDLHDIDYLVEEDVLNKKIKRALSPKESLDSLKPKLHIPILLLHECELTKSEKELNQEYKENIIREHKERAQSYFEKQVKKISDKVYKYSDIILFPVPIKKNIIDEFVNIATFHQNR
ncbi:HamA C-terminal domain-containing protein [Tenacibaculum maritimum]|uniref:HamA C-terminal domain-containing protein n=1 Tax=Tenacibaculum maritimum TaxID=107401 RepID=UPI0038777B08